MNLMELYLDFETKWQEEEFGVCDCPNEINEEYPYPCKHMPTNKNYKEWLMEQETRFHELLKMMTII